MSSRRLSELSAEQEVWYTGDVSFLVITMSKTSGVAKVFYGLVVGVSGAKIRHFSPFYSQPRVPIHVLGVEVASHEDLNSPSEAGGMVHSDQWAGRGEVSRKIFHRFSAIVTLMALTSKWVRPGMGTEW
jgi:hypothetical protein